MADLDAGRRMELEDLVGVIVPGERVPAISGKTVTFRDGVAVTPEPTAIRAATGD